VNSSASGLAGQLDTGDERIESRREEIALGVDSSRRHRRLVIGRIEFEMTLAEDFSGGVWSDGSAD